MGAPSNDMFQAKVEFGREEGRQDVAGGFTFHGVRQVWARSSHTREKGISQGFVRIPIEPQGSQKRRSRKRQASARDRR